MVTDVSYQKDGGKWGEKKENNGFATAKQGLSKNPHFKEKGKMFVGYDFAALNNRKRRKPAEKGKGISQSASARNVWSRRPSTKMTLQRKYNNLEPKGGTFIEGE